MIDSNLTVTSVMASEVKATTGGKKAFSPFSVDSLLSHRERVINNNSGAIPRAVVLPQKQEADDKEAESEERRDLKSEEEQTPRGEIVHKAKEYPCASTSMSQNELYSRFCKLFSESSTGIPTLLPYSLLPRQARGTLR